MGPHPLLIAGTTEDGAGPEVTIADPSTEDIVATVASASPEQVQHAVAAAAGAFPAWRNAAQDERSNALHAAATAIRDHADDLAEVATRETGRTLARNLVYVDWIARLFDQYAELARVHAGRLVASNEPGQLSLVRRAPFGVVVAVVPFNYPLLLAAFKLAPALATGNTVVLKGAPETTVTTLRLGALVAAAVPAGVVNVLAGRGEVGEALVAHPGVDLVAFTGSTAVGRRIGAVCAARSTPAHLELGGKDPAIVFDDADPALAAQGVAWAAFLNAGQVCTSTERAYVQRPIYDEFVAHAVDLAAGLRVGDPFDPKTQVGPMRSEAGRRRVLGQIEAARQSGATLLTGGVAPPGRGFFLAPAVLTGVDHSMELMREETFGPVLPIMPFDDDDEGLALAADSPYGLGASIYTADADRVRRTYEELRVGTVWVNDPLVDNLAAPFGGMRASGNARELGVEGLEAFTTVRHVHWNMRLAAKPWWFRPGEES